jgi:predicted permease
MAFTQNFAIPCLLFRAISTLDLGQTFQPALLGSFYIGAIAGFSLGLFGARILFKAQLGRQRRHWILLPVLKHSALRPAYHLNVPMALKP